MRDRRFWMGAAELLEHVAELAWPDQSYLWLGTLLLRCVLWAARRMRRLEPPTASDTERDGRR